MTLPMDRFRPRPLMWLAASGTADVTARRLAPMDTPQPVPTVAWRAARAGLVVHDRFMPWDAVVSLHLELGSVGFAGLRRAGGCILGAADGTRYRLEGSAEDWATLCAQISNQAVDRLERRASPHALPIPGMSPLPTPVSQAPAPQAVPEHRSTATRAWAWYQLTAALGTLAAILLLSLAMLLFPVRSLLLGHVVFADFVWVVPMVLALEVARLGWVRRRRTRHGSAVE
ncbi:MAG: hypothetical protein ACYC18_07540 [Gammaproteobacteria bacterium]